MKLPRNFLPRGFFIVLCLVRAQSYATETSLPCQGALTRSAQVSFMRFFGEALRAKANIHNLVRNLEEKFSAKNFQVKIPFSERRLFIFQERDLIQSVMRKDARLPFVNKNFDLSHGHFHSINSVDTTDALWHDLHFELFDIFKTHPIAPLMQKHKALLNSEGVFNLNARLEDFFLKVWGEYCFGSIDHTQFRKTRGRLIDVLTKVFHTNKLNRVPWLGNWTSRLNRRLHSRELEAVDGQLRELLAVSIAERKGAFGELYHRLAKKYPNAFEITLDNSFLAVLVYDFIHIVSLDALARLAQDPQKDPATQFKESRHAAFLYPFRFREVAEDFDDFRRGDFCILNLQKSGLYFSAGPRTCPGAGLFNDIVGELQSILSASEIAMLRPQEAITTTGNPDLPFMTSSHDVKVSRCPFSRFFAKGKKPH
jgi:hypothetical protein